MIEIKAESRRRATGETLSLRCFAGGATPSAQRPHGIAGASESGAPVPDCPELLRARLNWCAVAPILPAVQRDSAKGVANLLQDPGGRAAIRWPKTRRSRCRLDLPLPPFLAFSAWPR